MTFVFVFLFQVVFLLHTVTTNGVFCSVIGGNPLAEGGGPLVDLGISEPETNLVVGALVGVAAVDDVPANGDGVVTTNGARGGVARVGGAEDDAAGLDDAFALPNHGDNGGAAGHVVNQALEEGLGLEVIVVLGSVLLARGKELEGDQLVALPLEASDDLANLLGRRSGGGNQSKSWEEEGKSFRADLPGPSGHHQA